MRINIANFKTKLLVIATIALSLFACTTTSKYCIEGTITGGAAGHVYLLVQEGRKMDTLARSSVTNGKFYLSGSVTGIKPAFIVLEGQRKPSVSLILENTKFMVNVNLDNSTENQVEGTANQQAFNLFNVMTAEAQKVSGPLVQAYNAAYRAKDSVGMQIFQAKIDSLSKVNIEKEEIWLEAIEKNKLAWKHVADLECEVFRLYCATEVPHSVLLDENNVIVATNLRGKVLIDKVAEMLK